MTGPFHRRGLHPLPPVGALKRCQDHTGKPPALPHRDLVPLHAQGPAVTPGADTHGATPAAGQGHTGLGWAELRAKTSPRCLKIHGRETGKRHSSCQESQICIARHLRAPPLTQPGQLMIPINNPDPEISDRSHNQSKVSPEAASQLVRGETHAQPISPGPSLDCGLQDQQFKELPQLLRAQAHH